MSISRTLSRVSELVIPIFQTESRVEAILISTEYRDYNDEYYEGYDITARFDGTHEDKDLDAIPEVRRLEREAEFLLNSISYINDEEAGIQEHALIMATRDAIRLSINDEDEYPSTERGTISTFENGSYGKGRPYISLSLANPEISAHDEMIIRAAKSLDEIMPYLQPSEKIRPMLGNHPLHAIHIHPTNPSKGFRFVDLTLDADIEILNKIE